MKREEKLPNYTAADQMVVSAARQIKDGDVIFVGTGLPVMATYLAEYMHAPNCVTILEVGIIRTSPSELSISIETLNTQSMSDSLSDLFYVTSLAQHGFINLGFLGAGQVDRYGNVNDTVIGDYYNPVYRWLGSGGANDVISFCKRTIIMLRQSRQRFPEKVDFITCPGYIDGKSGSREAAGLLPDTGPAMVITNLGIYTFKSREMVLKSIHTGVGVTLDQVKAEVGWDLKISSDLEETEPPTREEIHILREKVDPNKLYIDGKRTVVVDQDSSRSS
ncbi:CoA-transferase subunit beta [Chloroflexota bacterium]